MQRVVKLYSSSIGKKITMAVTGFMLAAFVLIHMLGNLKIFQAPVEYHGETMPKIDAYGHFLREAGFPVLGHGDLLWIFRIGLIVLAALHIWSAIAVWRMSSAARPQGYKKEDGDKAVLFYLLFAFLSLASLFFWLLLFLNIRSLLFPPNAPFALVVLLLLFALLLLTLHLVLGAVLLVLRTN